MDNQRRLGPPNVCALCAAEEHLIEEMRKNVLKLKVVQQTVKQRLSRLFSRIDACEKSMAELGLYEAKKSE